MSRASYTAEEKAAALKQYQEYGVAETARRTGIPKGTISSWAVSAGLESSARETTRAACEAQSLNFKARRQRIAERLLTQAEGYLDRMEDPEEYQTLARVEGSEESIRPGFIPSKDRQHEATAFAILIDKEKILTERDDDGGKSEAQSMLKKLGDQLGVPSDRGDGTSDQ